MYAERLHIYDFRCFGKARLDLQYPGRRGADMPELPNVNLILGDNGGGKSSVLRALAIAVLSPTLLDSGFVPYRMVRRPRAKTALLRADALLQADEVERHRAVKEIELLARLDARPGSSRDRLHLKSTPRNPILARLHDDYSPAFFMVGYGATRRVETGELTESSARRSRGLRYQRVAGLFEDHVTLRPLQNWLLRIRQSRLRSAAVALLNDVLPDHLVFRGRFDERENQYLFEFAGERTPFAALSDGYKAFIGWVGDLIGHLTDIAEEPSALRKISGIVLVDEIDLHLHPEWQRTVVPTLANAFPRLQFVLTSHSPLVASSVRRENVFVTDTADDGTATIKQLEERVHGRSAEQILLSSYFGLKTTRPDAFRDATEELFAKAATGNSRAALEYLDRLNVPAVEPKTEPRRPVAKTRRAAGVRGAKRAGRAKRAK